METKKQEHQTIYFKVVRETSKYNKYMKWHVICYRSDKETLLSSDYAKTKQQAHDKCKQTRPIPIGDDRLLITTYEELI